MISLPNFSNNVELTQDQYDTLLDRYIHSILDGMDLDDLIQFASDQMEMNLRANCSTPDELLEEIERVYDSEGLEDLLEGITNSNEDQ